MNQHDIIQAFSKLGAFMKSLCDQEATDEELVYIREVIQREKNHNGWFTVESIYKSLESLSEMLSVKDLDEWASQYTFTSSPKKVGVIMAGNIPLVGFHDLLCVLVSGHHALIKLSSDDSRLLPLFLERLVQLDPRMKERFIVVPRLNESEAVIATGSNNSARYFEKYFGHQPHIIRRNRTSVAIIDGSESPKELELLGTDIFSYFGMGCRNVSQLFIPKDFNIDRFFAAIIG